MGVIKVPDAYTISVNKSYDVAVIGAGPAGGQCARELSHRGYSVLLVDRLANFAEKNFSSAGTLSESLAEFDLPPSIVNAQWQSCRFISSSEESHKRYTNPVGVVLEFSKLREFLAEDAKKNGAQVLLNHAYLESCVEKDQRCSIKLRDLSSGEICNVNARIVVDATGPNRAVIGNRPDQKFISGFGQEWVVRYSNAPLSTNELVFFMGHHYAPHGYAWIFPNGPDNWKVGYGFFVHDEKKTHSLVPFIEKIIDQYFPAKEKREIIDKHGSFLRHTPAMRDLFWDPSRKVIAVGDSTSLCNPLAGEGIRHALRGAVECADTIEEFLNGKKISARQYRRRLTKKIYWQWLFCEKYAVRSYLHKSDAEWDRSLRRLNRISAAQSFEIMFRYNFWASPRLLINFFVNLLREKFGLVPLN